MKNNPVQILECWNTQICLILFAHQGISDAQINMEAP